MDRKLIVILLKKHIQELEMITEGFMEMTTYPKPIVALARKKTEDILDYISELENLKPELTPVNSTNNEDSPREDNNTPTVDKIEESAEVTVETTVTEIIEEVVTTTYIEPLKQAEKIVNSEEPVSDSSENDAENEKDNLYSETEEDEFEEEDDEFEEDGNSIDYSASVYVRVCDI